jgi:hypothetical protein
LRAAKELVDVEVTGNGRTLAGLEVLDGRVISRQEIRRVDEGELLGGGDACALFLELVVIHRRHLCKPPQKKDGCTSSRASISVAVTGGEGSRAPGVRVSERLLGTAEKTMPE